MGCSETMLLAFLAPNRDVNMDCGMSIYPNQHWLTNGLGYKKLESHSTRPKISLSKVSLIRPILFLNF